MKKEKVGGDPLRSRLEEARGRLIAAEEGISEAKAALHSISGKIQDLAGRRQNKVFLREQKVKDLESALKGVEENAAIEATEELHKLDRELGALTQLHEAAIKSKVVALGEVKAAEKLLDSGLHEFWFAVSLIECRKVTSNETLIKAWLATQLGRVTSSFGDFLRTNFSSYAIPDLPTLRAELFKEYNRIE